MKARYTSCRIEYAGEIYQVDLRVTKGRKPARAGADSPRYLDPGVSPRASVIRILNRAGIVVVDQVTHELSHWAERDIREAALSLAARSGVGSGAVGFSPPSPAAPLFSDAEDLR